MTVEQIRDWLPIIQQDINAAQERLRTAVEPSDRQREQKHIDNRRNFQNVLERAVQGVREKVTAA